MAAQPIVSQGEGQEGSQSLLPVLFGNGLWSHIRPDDRRNLRLACKESRELSLGAISSFELNLWVIVVAQYEVRQAGKDSVAQRIKQAAIEAAGFCNNLFKLKHLYITYGPHNIQQIRAEGKGAEGEDSALTAYLQTVEPRVLDSISGLTLDVKDTVRTKFKTEYILRHLSGLQHVSLSVRSALSQPCIQALCANNSNHVTSLHVRTQNSPPIPLAEVCVLNSLTELCLSETLGSAQLALLARGLPQLRTLGALTFFLAGLNNVSSSGGEATDLTVPFPKLTTLCSFGQPWFIVAGSGSSDFGATVPNSSGSANTIAHGHAFTDRGAPVSLEQLQSTTMFNDWGVSCALYDASPELLTAWFPALTRLHGVCILNNQSNTQPPPPPHQHPSLLPPSSSQHGPASSSSALPSALQRITQRFAACAHEWAIAANIMVNEVASGTWMRTLPPCSLLHVRRLCLSALPSDVDPDHTRDLFRTLAAAAPHVAVVDVSYDVLSLAASAQHQAALLALARHLAPHRRLHHVHLQLGGMHGTPAQVAASISRLMPGLAGLVMALAGSIECGQLEGTANQARGVSGSIMLGGGPCPRRGGAYDEVTHEAAHEAHDVHEGGGAAAAAAPLASSLVSLSPTQAGPPSAPSAAPNLVKLHLHAREQAWVQGGQQLLRACKATLAAMQAHLTLVLHDDAAD